MHVDRFSVYSYSTHLCLFVSCTKYGVYVSDTYYLTLFFFFLFFLLLSSLVITPLRYLHQIGLLNTFYSVTSHFQSCLLTKADTSGFNTMHHGESCTALRLRSTHWSLCCLILSNANNLGSHYSVRMLERAKEKDVKYAIYCKAPQSSGRSITGSHNLGHTRHIQIWTAW
jgi:hypothetical protein